MAKEKKKTTRKKEGPSPGKDEPAFEQALQRLENLVQRLEDGDVPLEESLQAYAEGTQLIHLCMQRLDKAEALIRELHESTQGFRMEASSLGDEDGDEDEDEGEDEDEDEDEDYQDSKEGTTQDELGF